MENKELNNSLTSDDLGIVTGGENVGHTAFITCPYCGSGETWLVKGNELIIKEISAETDDPAAVTDNK